MSEGIYRYGGDREYKGHKYYINQMASTGLWMAVFDSTPARGYECTLQKFDEYPNGKSHETPEGAVAGFKYWIDFCERMINWRESCHNSRPRPAEVGG